MRFQERIGWAAVGAALLGTIGCDKPDARADVIVYGGHIPELKAPDAPFTNPFSSRELSTDAPTTSVLRDIKGLKNPRGTVSWNVAALGKYVFLGNYEHNANGGEQFVEDQRLGLYDSETKKFCQLDLKPNVDVNASVSCLAVADPKSRKTRIYYQGIASESQSEVDAGYAFGYIAADLDNADPCNASTGWVAQSRGYRPAELNAASRAAGMPEACPDPTPGDPRNDRCSFDGIALLHHSANADTIVLNNWSDRRLVIVEVDGAGALRMRAVHVLPLERRPDACYQLLPVASASVDQTRSEDNLRFVQAFENVCATSFAPGEGVECPSRGICPADATLACSGSCVQSYCSKPLPFFNLHVKAPTGGTCGGQPASCTNYPSFSGCVNLGVATNTCLRVSPHATCSQNADRSSTRCTCDRRETQTAQEYRYNFVTKTLQATSHFFQRASDESIDRLDGSFAATGDAFFISNKLGNNVWSTQILRYARDQSGNHSYNEAGPVSLSDGRWVVRPPTSAETYPLKPRLGYEWAGFPGSFREVANAMYVLSRDTVQRYNFFGTWRKDASYKVALGMDDGATLGVSLPQESRVCNDVELKSCASDTDCEETHECINSTYCRRKPSWGCQFDADCGSGQYCPKLSCRKSSVDEGSTKPCASNGDCANGESCAPVLGGSDIAPTGSALGGAPSSLWTAVHQNRGNGDYTHKNAYLNRIPVALPVPGDNKTSVPPALAWSTKDTCPSGKCDRLWLFGAQSGVLRYRTRDQGLWANGWHNLPQNVVIAGGLAAAFTATTSGRADGTVELFGRAQSDGRLYWGKLNSALDCSPGSTCQWTNWQLVPNAPLTDTEAAATVAWPGGKPFVFVAVKDKSGRLWVNQRGSSGWSTWRAMPGLTTNASPSLIFKIDENSLDGQVWLFARDSSNNSIKYARVDTTTPGSWGTAGGAGAQAWTSAPTAAFTGRVRLLTTFGSGLDVKTYQTTFDGSAWDEWKPIFTRSGSTVRPAAAVVNGDLNVITSFMSSMDEQLVK